MPALDDEARHAPDDGALFVLNDDLAAGGADALASDEPVASHARHHDREHMTAVDPGDRAKQHVGRRPAGILRRLLMDPNPDLLTVPRDRHVKIARRDRRTSRRERLVQAPLDDANAALGGEPLGEELRKGRRHVLDDHDRHGKVLRESGNEIHERRRAAGRHAQSPARRPGPRCGRHRAAAAPRRSAPPRSRRSTAARGSTARSSRRAPRRGAASQSPVRALRAGLNTQATAPSASASPTRRAPRRSTG